MSIDFFTHLNSSVASACVILDLILAPHLCQSLKILCNPALLVTKSMGFRANHFKD